MCCCGKPTRNDEQGAYSWDGKNRGTYGIEGRAPELAGAVVVYDEMGRCQPTANGKVYHVDHHAHHYRIFRTENGSMRAFVRHGGGTVEIGDYYYWGRLAMLMEKMTSDERFILFMSVESLVNAAERKAKEETGALWRTAAAEKRIKTRKVRGTDRVKVWIDEPAPAVFG